MLGIIVLVIPIIVGMEVGENWSGLKDMTNNTDGNVSNINNIRNMYINSLKKNTCNSRAYKSVNELGKLQTLIIIITSLRN